jgi:hypothetical protein
MLSKSCWLDQLKAPAPVAVSDIAIRLAGEGVPLCAIARAIRVPSGELRQQLEAARLDGRLADLPPVDWDRRPPRPCDHDRQALAVRMIFGATPAETALLLTLMRCGSVAKQRFSAPESVTVQIHHLRKRLAPFGIQIISIWGHGYALADGDRERLLAMISP